MSEQMATTNIGMTMQNSTPTTSENQAELEAGCRKTQIWCIVGTRDSLGVSFTPATGLFCVSSHRI